MSREEAKSGEPQDQDKERLKTVVYMTITALVLSMAGAGLYQERPVRTVAEVNADNNRLAKVPSDCHDRIVTATTGTGFGESAVKAAALKNSYKECEDVPAIDIQNGVNAALRIRDDARSDAIIYPSEEAGKRANARSGMIFGALTLLLTVGGLIVSRPKHPISE